MENRGRVSTKGREDLCTKEYGIKGRDHLITPQCTSSKTWREIEDSKIGHQKLLVARSNKRCRKIYRRM